MEQEQNRLDRLERDLTNRYAKLEALLAELEGVQDNLDDLVSQLSSD
jgi:flagellar hook-associated protein 2